MLRCPKACKCSRHPAVLSTTGVGGDGATGGRYAGKQDIRFNTFSCNSSPARLDAPAWQCRRSSVDGRRHDGERRSGALSTVPEHAASERIVQRCLRAYVCGCASGSVNDLYHPSLGHGQYVWSAWYTAAKAAANNADRSHNRTQQGSIKRRVHSCDTLCLIKPCVYTARPMVVWEFEFRSAEPRRIQLHACSACMCAANRQNI